MPVKQNPLTAYEEAMRSLAALRKERDTDDIKGFYTRLNDVLRAYLNRQLGIATFEKTNEEIILQSKQIDLPRSESEQLAQALRLSDFVKFAKYKPVASDNEKALTVIEAAINIINNKTTKKPG